MPALDARTEFFPPLALFTNGQDTTVSSLPHAPAPLRSSTLGVFSLASSTCILRFARKFRRRIDFSCRMANGSLLLRTSVRLARPRRQRYFPGSVPATLISTYVASQSNINDDDVAAAAADDNDDDSDR